MDDVKKLLEKVRPGGKIKLSPKTVDTIRKAGKISKVTKIGRLTNPAGWVTIILEEAIFIIVIDPLLNPQPANAEPIPPNPVLPDPDLPKPTADPGDEEKPNVWDGPGSPGKVEVDPSGYVYEAVASNRLSGITATVYWRGEDGTAVKWDAAEYDQIPASTITGQVLIIGTSEKRKRASTEALFENNVSREGCQALSLILRIIAHIILS